MKLRHVSPGDVYESLRSRGYTQVVTAREFSELIVLSGHMPYDENNKLVGEGDIELQARTVFENVRRSLRAVGADLRSIVRMTTYLVDLRAHTAGVRKVRAELFGAETPPASTMIEVARLPAGVLIEVEAWAVA